MFASSLSIEKRKWSQSFQKYYSIQPDELESLLLTGMMTHSQTNSQPGDDSVTTSNSQKSKKSKKFSKSLSDGRLFAVTSRNLKEYDFQSLVNLGWLKKGNHQGEVNQVKYLKLDKFPEFFLTRIEEVQNPSEQFTNEELSAFNHSFSQPINGIQRFFIHAEYIIHPRLYNRVESLQKHLKDIWAQDNIPLVKLRYQSAKLYHDTVDCIVYPVCIYYYQRAPYLFAYGQTPKQDDKNSWSKIDWYDYRLDRILELDELPKM